MQYNVCLDKVGVVVLLSDDSPDLESAVAAVKFLAFFGDVRVHRRRRRRCCGRRTRNDGEKVGQSLQLSHGPKRRKGALFPRT